MADKPLSDVQKAALRDLAHGGPGSAQSTNIKQATLDALSKRKLVESFTVDTVVGPHTVYSITRDGERVLWRL